MKKKKNALILTTIKYREFSDRWEVDFKFEDLIKEKS